MNRSTQREKIKECLWARFGEWVPLPEILPFAAQYSARIHELRRELLPHGFEIQNKRERQPDGTVHSWFRLTECKPIDVAPAQPKAIQKATPISQGDWYEREHGPRPSDSPAAQCSELPLFAGTVRK